MRYRSVTPLRGPRRAALAGGTRARPRPLGRRGGLRPSRRFYVILGLMAFLFLSGMATGFDLAVRLNYALALLIIISYLWSTWGFERLSAVVERPGREMSVGERISDTVTLRNQGGPPKSWVEVEDQTDIPGMRIAQVVSLPNIVAFRRFTVSTRLTQRGVFTLGPLVVRASDPFGLFPIEQAFAERQQILVYPQVIEVPDYATPAAELLGDSSRRRRTQLLSPEVSSVRGYEPGDSVSRIHWPSTARVGKLMVKLFERGRASEVWVLMDQDASTVLGEGAESTDEYAATIAASTVNRYLNVHVPTGFAGHGSESLLLPPERGAGQRDAIMRHIAASRPTGKRPLFSVLAELERQVGRNSSLATITAAPDGDWVDALGALQKRGVHCVAVLLERASFGDETRPSARDRLLALGVRTHVVRRGASIAGALAESEGMTRISAEYRLRREAAV